MATGTTEAKNFALDRMTPDKLSITHVVGRNFVGAASKEGVSDTNQFQRGLTVPFPKDFSFQVVRGNKFRVALEERHITADKDCISRLIGGNRCPVGSLAGSDPASLVAWPVKNRGVAAENDE